MNSNRVKGAMDELAGSAKRKVGKLTGNTPLQVRGAVQQVRGKAQNTVGKVQDAVQGAGRRAKSVRLTRP